MKPINRRLLVTSGLFVALYSLTSFSPSNGISLAASDQEGSITLAQTSPTAKDRDAKRDSGESTKNSTSVAAKIAALKNKGAPEAKPVTQPAVTAAPDAKTIPSTFEKKSEGQVCPDGKCGAGTSEKNSSLLEIAEILPKLDPKEQNLILSKYSIKEQDFIRSKAKESDVADDEDPEENICVDGEYTERISCFEKEQKSIKSMKSHKVHGRYVRKSEQRELLDDAISDFIEEITLDTDLTSREMNRLVKKLSKLTKGDRDLQQQMRVAQSYLNATKNADAFSQQLQRSADQIGNLDMQINQLQSNPYTMQQANILKIQRYQVLNGVKSQVEQFQKQYKSALPPVNKNESNLVTALREQMTEDYQAIISPVAAAITDQRLLTLENLPLASIASTASAVPGQSGSVFGPQASTVPMQQTQIAPQQGIVYNNMNPTLTNTDVSHMTPAQQVQMRIGSIQTSATLMNGAQATGMIPGQMPGQIPTQMPPQGNFTRF